MNLLAKMITDLLTTKWKSWIRVEAYQHFYDNNDNTNEPIVIELCYNTNYGPKYGSAIACIVLTSKELHEMLFDGRYPKLFENTIKDLELDIVTQINKLPLNKKFNKDLII